MNKNIKVIKTNSVYKLDQFFTKENIAAECVAEVNSICPLNKFSLIIEPSAGTGSFVKVLPLNQRVAVEIDIDLCKENNDYICKSFFDYNPDPDPIGGQILVIGNPPFGTQNKLSVDFFNHAAKFADMIAFIIPRTWNKQSVQDRLDSKFLLIQSMDLPEDCFFGDKATNVKCCFQIWGRSKIDRIKKKKIIEHKDWEFLPYIKAETDLFPPDDADFVILAYGSNPGQVSTNLYEWRPKSVHFIKSKIEKKKLMERFSELDYSCANNSARQSSLCKADLVRLYSERYSN